MRADCMSLLPWDLVCAVVAPLCPWVCVPVFVLESSGITWPCLFTSQHAALLVIWGPGRTGARRAGPTTGRVAGWRSLKLVDEGPGWLSRSCRLWLRGSVPASKRVTLATFLHADAASRPLPSEAPRGLNC